VSVFFTFLKLSVPLEIHFSRQANPFGSGQRQTKTALSSDKAVIFLAGSQKSPTCCSKAIIKATFNN